MKIHSKLFGIDLKITYPILAATTIGILLDTSHYIEICMLSALLHELGHLSAMLICKSKPTCIEVGLFAINILDTNRCKRKFMQEIFIIYAGIIVNILTFILFYLVYKSTNLEILLKISMSSLVIGAFNLLPVATLDGGQGLCLILLQKLTYHQTEIIINILTILMLIPFTVCGIILLLNSKNNFSLLTISIYLIVSLIVRKELI